MKIVRPRAYCTSRADSLTSVLMDLTVEMFRPEMVEALKLYEKHVVCIDKTPDECQESMVRLMEKAIKAYETRGPHLRRIEPREHLPREGIIWTGKRARTKQLLKQSLVVSTPLCSRQRGIAPDMRIAEARAREKIGQIIAPSLASTRIWNSFQDLKHTDQGGFFEQLLSLAIVE